MEPSTSPTRIASSPGCRTALAAERDHAIARSELLPVELVPVEGAGA